MTVPPLSSFNPVFLPDLTARGTQPPLDVPTRHGGRAGKTGVCREVIKCGRVPLRAQWESNGCSSQVRPRPSSSRVPKGGPRRRPRPLCSGPGASGTTDTDPHRRGRHTFQSGITRVRTHHLRWGTSSGSLLESRVDHSRPPVCRRDTPSTERRGGVLVLF